MIYFILILVFVGCGLFLTYNQKKKIHSFYQAVKRDLKIFIIMVNTLFTLWIHKKKNSTVAKQFTLITNKHPHKVAFYFEGESWTYKDIEILSNKIANYFKNKGYKKGDVVALYLESRPEYVCILLGLSKIGVITALLNTNIVEDSLIHSIKVSEATSIIYGSNLKEAIQNIINKFPNTKLYEFNENSTTNLLPEAINLKNELKSVSDLSPIEEIKKGNFDDKLIYIYTSGTTGVPKAAIITNKKYLMVSIGSYKLTSLKTDDIIYSCLPLYHSTGGILAIGESVIMGITVVLRKKFSSTNFWQDCNKYNCNVALYIGEMCRYLLANKTNIKQHQITKIIGTGLKPQIWKTFLTEFNIKEVYEIYGSTEGNVNMFNIYGIPGAVGYIPRWAASIYPSVLIKCDLETAIPILDSNGFCQVCKAGEPGLLIGKVVHNKILSAFAGYVDKEATNKKILKNVLQKGDKYFNSGDILVQDENGFYYFRDRVGDTFRWKGENVATTEVEAIISNILNLEDCVVYGVEIPGTDGKAGMASLVNLKNTLDLHEFCKNLKTRLPSYSIPFFLRLLESIPKTATFKLKKTDLRKEGFNIEKIKDKLFVYDAKNVTYRQLTKSIYDEIMLGKLRF